MTSTDQRPPAPTRRPVRRKRPSVLAAVVTPLAFVVEAAWARVRPWGGWGWLVRAGAVLFVAALPVALIATNVRLLFTAEPLYTFAVERYDVPAVTGIPRPEIDRAMAEIRDYFTNDQQLLRITVTDERGRTNPLFTPREVLHMRDVKQLVQSIFTAQSLALGFVAAYVALRLLVEGRAGLVGLARLTRIAALGTLAVAAAFGVTALLGFERLFEQFHLLSFRNDFWRLDPAQDHLVQMFPFEFWLVATLLLVGLTVVELLTLLALARWYLRRTAELPATVANETPPRARMGERVGG